MAQQKSNRGGLRNPPGGRPRLPPEKQRVRCGFFTLPFWLEAWLKAQQGQGRTMGEIVEEALVVHYGIKPPG